MTQNFTLTFDTGNAAFDDGNGPVEVARILKHVAACIEFKGAVKGTVHDLNGNRVGEWELSLPEEDDEADEDVEWAVFYPNSKMVARALGGAYMVYPTKAQAERAARNEGDGYTVGPWGQ